MSCVSFNYRRPQGREAARREAFMTRELFSVRTNLSNFTLVSMMTSLLLHFTQAIRNAISAHPLAVGSRLAVRKCG